MSSLALPAIASFNSQLWLGGPTSPPSYVLLARIGDVKFNGLAIDTVDVSNQTSRAHRKLGTLLNPGDLTFMLYIEPSSTQDSALDRSAFHGTAAVAAVESRPRRGNRWRPDDLQRLPVRDAH